MTNAEFSNEFDVLYNSITSNQAPGLDVYEKSVFLTKAQDEIVKSYFNPRSNKTQEGYDGNERRQIDFSMIMRSERYKRVSFTVSEEITGPTYSSIKSVALLNHLIETQDGVLTINQFESIDRNFITVLKAPSSIGQPQRYLVDPFISSFFDLRDNTRAIALNSEILMFVNEYVEVTRNDKSVRLTVLPISYTEYSRLMSKPYKRPLKYQAWRLLDNSDGHKKAELIVGPIDTITEYVTRYVKRPRAIILDVLSEDTSLDGYVGADSSGNPTTDLSQAVQGIECELDPILHQEILQRAVELAKASYTGDLQSQVVLGQTSQTGIGVVQANK